MNPSEGLAFEAKTILHADYRALGKTEVATLMVEKAGLTVEKILIVRELLNVFPEELPGLSAVREVEFGIEVIPGTNPISK